MVMEMFSLPSSRAGSELACYRWMPGSAPRCTIQILHGMLEYIPRYEEFAAFMNERGVAVFGHDHLGHGRTSPAEPGFFNDADGDLNLVRDARIVAEHIASEVPGVPHFIIGHSMGSYIARRLMTCYGGSVDGVIAVGTGSRRTDDAEGMVAAAQKVVDESGVHAYSEDLDAMVLGRNFSRVKTGASSTAEMTEERRNRLRFQASGYRDLFMLTLRLSREEGFDSIPALLPVAFFSGSEDMVGAKGEGVKAAAKALEGYGLKPYVHIYEGMNHDILHEEGCRTVFADVYDWIAALI